MSDLNTSMRARFWELDGKVRAIQAKLKPIEDARDALAAKEAELRGQAQALAAQQRKIIEESDLIALSKERSRAAQYLDGKTGAHP